MGPARLIGTPDQPFAPGTTEADTSRDAAVIRPARPGDLEALVALTRATYREHALRQPDWFPEDAAVPTELALRQILGPKPTLAKGWETLVLVAERQGRIVGYVSSVLPPAIAHSPGRLDRVATIWDISVASGERGRGVGRQLLQATQEAMHDLGCTVLQADVWSGNDASQAMFRAAGHQPVNETFRLRLAQPVRGEPPSPGTTGRWLRILERTFMAAVVLWVLIRLLL